MPYPLFDFGGNGPIMNLAIANGFPPQTYQPLMQPFTDRYHVVSLMPRALWTPPPPPESLTSWRQKSADLLAGLDEHGFLNVIGVGHSMGGIATMLAAIAQPQRFRALILLDPTLLRPALLNFIALMRTFGQAHRMPLAVGARRRRSEFESVDAAYNYWRSKRLFSDWSDETVRLYAESMTRPSANGNGVTLTWSPEWEAQFYVNILTDSWREVPKLRGLLPTLVIRGTTTDTFIEVSARKFRKLVPDATMVEIEGHGHLFPQSAPDQTRRIIEDWLASLQPSSKS